jgi:hypothetical protein
MYLSTRPFGEPLWFMVNVYPVSLATFLACSFKVGRMEHLDKVRQPFGFLLPHISIKEMKTPFRIFPDLRSILSTRIHKNTEDPQLSDGQRILIASINDEHHTTV